MKGKIKLEILFWIGYFLIVFSEMFINVKFVCDYTEIITIIGLLFLIVYMLFFSKYYTKKDFLLMILLFGMSIYTYFICRDFTIIKFLILVYCLKNISFDRLIKKDFYIKISLFAILILLSIFGMCNITSFNRGTTIRYTLGFIHPNTTGFYIMLLALEYMYIFKEKKSINKMSIIIVGICINSLLADSRSSVLALILLAVSILIFKIFKNILNSRIICFIIKNFMIILTILSLFISVSYLNNEKWAIDLNDKLSNRLFYLSNSIEKYDVKAFGNEIPANAIIDNQYIFFLLNFGFVFYIVYYILFYMKFKELIKSKNNLLLILLLILLVYGLMEKTVFKASYNVFILSLSSVLFNHKKEKKYE